MVLPGTRTFLLPGSAWLIISCQQAQWPAASHVQNCLNVDLKRPVVKDLGNVRPQPSFGQLGLGLGGMAHWLVAG